MTLSRHHWDQLRAWSFIAAIVMLLVWSIWFMAGCQAAPTAEQMADARATAVQIEAKDSIIDSLEWHLQDIQRQLGGVMTPEDRAELEGQITSMRNKLGEVVQEREGLVAKVEQILTPGTPIGEQIQGGATIVGSLLPFPWNVVVTGVAGLIFGGAGMKRRKDNQIRGTVLSIENARDGNGGINMAKAAELQAALGIKSVVDAALTRIGGPKHSP